MLIDKYAQVRWNGRTRKHYEDRGYVWTKQNDFFECRIEDVQKTSPIKVSVSCYYCSESFKQEYRNYITIMDSDIPKSCCKNCVHIKRKEMFFAKHGVEHPMQLQENKDKLSEIFRTPIETVLKLCEEKNIKILDIENYRSDRSRIHILCEKHKEFGKQETCFANIKSNKHCCIHIRPEIISLLKKKSGEEVYQAFIESGFNPLFKPSEYVGSGLPLPYSCPKHLEKGVQYRSFSNLKYTEGCGECAMERRISKMMSSQDDVFSYFVERGYIPLEEETYKGKEKLIRFTCLEHPNEIQRISVHGLKITQEACKFCRIEDSNYAINRRFRSSIGSWIKKIEEECGFKCVLTENEQYDVHHIYGYSNIIQNALDNLQMKAKEDYTPFEISLLRDEVLKLHESCKGVCLDRILHVEFHKMFGKVNNTEEQFVEFTEMYENGYFNHLLDKKEVC